MLIVSVAPQRRARSRRCSWPSMTMTLLAPISDAHRRGVDAEAAGALDHNVVAEAGLGDVEGLHDLSQGAVHGRGGGVVELVRELEEELRRCAGSSTARSRRCTPATPPAACGRLGTCRRPSRRGCSCSSACRGRSRRRQRGRPPCRGWRSESVVILLPISATVPIISWPKTKGVAMACPPATPSPRQRWRSEPQTEVAWTRI